MRIHIASVARALGTAALVLVTVRYGGYGVVTVRPRPSDCVLCGNVDV